MFLVTAWFGSFLIDDGEIVAHRLFPQTVEGIVDRNRAIRNGAALPEEHDLISDHKDVMVNEIRLLGLPNTTRYNGADFPPRPSPGEFGIHMDLLQQALILLSEQKLGTALAAREIIELIAALDDLNRTINLLSEREVEWRRVYLGGEVPKVFTNFTAGIQELSEYRQTLTSSIEEIMQAQNPTLSVLAGELLGAHLIALAGGRERLARLPSGTIQILGAENAFFRFKQTGKGMPKHGVIFQHPMIRNAQKQNRGKIARTFAAKVALAARIDFYSGRNEGEFLKETLDQRIRMITDSGKK